MTATSKLNVLMVIPTLSRTGGAQHQLEILSKALLENGVRVNSYAPSEAVFDARLRSGLIGKMGLQIVKFAAVLKAFVFAFLNVWRYDVVHVHGLGTAFYVFSIVGKFFGRGVLVKVPRTGKASYLQLVAGSRIREFWFRIASKCVSSFIILTPDGRGELTGIGVPDSKIVEIPNGVEIITRTLARSPAPPLRICFAGRLIERKNVDQIIRAVAAVHSQNSAVIQLTIMGDGPSLRNLRELVEGLKLTESISFTGELDRKDVIGEFSQHHVFVLPSQSEGMSNALLQACETGCVPIVADIPQSRAILVHAETGFLFKTPEELKFHLVQLVDQTLRDRIAFQAHKMICDRYAISQTAKRYKRLYKKLVS